MPHVNTGFVIVRTALVFAIYKVVIVMFFGGVVLVGRCAGPCARRIILILIIAIF